MQQFSLSAVKFGQAHHAILDTALRMRTHRESHWDPQFDELAEFFHPNRFGFQSARQDGEDKRRDTYGSIAELARRGLATTCSTMLRPAGRTWFKAKAKNEQLNGQANVRLWCDIVTRITYQHLYDPRSQFEKQCAECDSDIVTFGTGAIQPGWNRQKRHLTFKTHNLKDVALCSDSGGAIDMAFVFWNLSLRQIVQMFPQEKLPTSITDKLRQPNADMNEKYEIVHACVPNADYKQFGGKRANRWPYMSLWIGIKDKHLIDEGGYYEFPYVVARWETITGEDYGRSPAMMALRDARLADAITKGIVDAAETALMPPLMAPVMGIRGTIDLRARGVTMYDPAGFGNYGRPPVEPIQLGEQPQKMLELLQMIEERIHAAFFRDILELPSARDDKKTATEINARLDQYLRQAAPVFSRLEAAYNAGIINRVFSILLREGAYPDPPEELQGEEIEFEYESPIKAAREKAEALKILEGIQMGLGGPDAMFAKMKPEILDNIDPDVLFRYILMRADVPEIVMTPLQKMLEQREQRAKEMQMAKYAELAKTAGPAMAQITGSLAKAKEAGMIGSNEPFPIPAGMGDQMVEDAVYEELAPAQ
jgi:hypothetical protein